MYKFFIFLIIFIVSGINTASASVVMTGTRVIFPEQAKEKTVQLRNPDNKAYLLQMQIDDHEEIKEKADSSSSFIVTPQIFRMEPNSGQSIRIKYIGDNLPQDRETIFYFSFSQLPLLKKNEQAANQLVLAVTSRVKIFYRPKGIAGAPADAMKALRFSLDGKRIKVSNPTGYHVVVRKASLLVNGREITLADSTLVAPKKETEWTPSASVSRLAGSQLRLVVVNDYGVDNVNTINL